MKTEHEVSWNEEMKRAGPVSDFRPLVLSLDRATAFWSYVDCRGPDDCWPWKGHIAPDGYGRYRDDRRMPRVASRIAWFLTNGQQPEVVCHTCDNPPCCNPSHLWNGSHGDNLRDAFAKGRSQAAKNAAKTHCVRGHEFSEANTRRRNGKRWCRACDAIRTANHKARKGEL